MIVFSALGHMIRDGWPPLGSTLAARVIGAAVIWAGLLIVTDWMAAGALALAILAGFYTDMRHGEANKGNWTAGIISGITSLVPLGIVASFLAWSAWWGLIVLAGVMKPIIWQGAWALDPGRYADMVPGWLAMVTEPTRVAAIIWGAWVGVLLLIVATQGV